MSTTAPTTINLSDIVIGARLRKDLGNLSEFDTIPKVGLIQPIVLQRKEDGTFHLMAGGRRTTALKALGYTQVHHGVTCDPTRPGFVWRDEVPDHLAREIELYENLNRKGMTWQERAMSIADIHALKIHQKALDGQHWGTTETGNEVGVTRASVSYAVKIAEALRSDPNHPVWKADGLTAALKLLIQEGVDTAKRELAKMSAAATNSTTSAPVVSAVQVNDLPTPAKAAPLTVNLSSFLHHGAMETILPTLPKVDHIITDWPYGIDMSNLQQQNTGMDVARVEATHDKWDNARNFQNWFRLMYDALGDSGFCITWCDLEHWNSMIAYAEVTGFKVCRWPLHWVKTHPCLNQAAQYNFTKAVEHALVLRKGNAYMTKAMPTNYWMGDNLATRKRFQSNPFAKPIDLWKWVFSGVAQPGQTVLDPFAGGGSSTCAAIEFGLKPIAVELDDLHYADLHFNVRNTYETLTNSNVQFI